MHDTYRSLNIEYRILLPDITYNRSSGSGHSLLSFLFSLHTLHTLPSFLLSTLLFLSYSLLSTSHPSPLSYTTSIKADPLSSFSSIFCLPSIPPLFPTHLSLPSPHLLSCIPCTQSRHLFGIHCPQTLILTTEMVKFSWNAPHPSEHGNLFHRKTSQQRF